MIDCLRVSLTDACNLRCVYCMPERMRFLPRDRLLTDEELLRRLHVFAEQGFHKVRFTPAVAMLGQLQAAEAAKLLLELPVPSAAGATLLFDFLQCCLTRIARPSV